IKFLKHGGKKQKQDLTPGTMRRICDLIGRSARSEQDGDVDYGVRLRAVDPGGAGDDARAVAPGQRLEATFDFDRKRLHLLLPSRRKRASAGDLLLQTRRQRFVPWRVVLANTALLTSRKVHADRNARPLVDHLVMPLGLVAVAVRLLIGRE